jgi:BirA family biotin operon repressor/biotin-[acetyl-CoA-carboxylase] ligase
MNWTIIKLETIDSTNNYLLSSIKERETDEYTVVVATEQTRGKGLGTNQWESEPGKNLTFSLLIRPGFLQASRQFYLHILISNAVYDAFEYFMGKAEISIKWPNDIYIKNGKAGGILINNTIQGDKIKESVIGVGLNVNQLVFKSNAPNPVSMKQICGKDFNLMKILDVILARFDYYYQQLIAGNFIDLKRKYESRLFRKHGYHEFRKDDLIRKARIINITETGKLCLEHINGSIREYDFKEIEFII